MHYIKGSSDVIRNSKFILFKFLIVTVLNYVRTLLMWHSFSGSKEAIVVHSFSKPLS